MRIAFLCPSGLDDPGPQRRFLPIARELVRRGHDVSLLMLHSTFAAVQQHRFVRDGVKLQYVAQMHVHGLPGKRRYYSPAGLLAGSLRAAAALAYAARRLRPDALHIAKAQPINGMAALLARPAAGALYLDADDYEAAANRFGGGWQRQLVAWWEDRLPRMVRAVSVNTSFLQRRCLALGVAPERIVEIPNGFDDRQAQLPPIRRRQALRAALGLTRPTIVYLGTMSTVAHGVGILLDAFAQLHRRRPDLQLLMVGDGDELPALRARAVAHGIAPAVRWVGRVAAEAAATYLALGDCSVDPVEDTPAAQARSPLKIVESLALGLPVVTGDVGDRAVMLGGGAAGVLCAAGDAAALAAGLEQAIDRSALLRAGALAQAEYYRWERIIDRWQTLYS